MTKSDKRKIAGLTERIEGDTMVWIIVLTLILGSVVCMFSSTSRLLGPAQTRLDILEKHLIMVALGLLVILACYLIRDIKWFRMLSKWGFPVSFLLLVMLDVHVSTPAVEAISTHGAYRILKIFGLEIHVFEIVKVAMVMYLAWAQDALKKKELKWPVEGLRKKIFYIYAPFLLTFVLVLPGSNSSALLIGGIMFLVILLGGGNFKDLSILLLSGIVALVLCFSAYKISDGKVFSRIGTGISRTTGDSIDDLVRTAHDSRKGSVPWNNAIDDLRQPYNALIAIHQGGLVGKGPGQSTQRYAVPAFSEDYMFSFIIEEYGLFGALIVIVLYVSLLARGAIIARNSGDDLYAKLVVAGLCLLITGQAFLHMLVNVDIGPMTGQTLPLLSHGNSAFLCFCLAFGIILSFSRIAVKKIESETEALEPLTPEENENYDEFDDYGVQ